MVQERVRLVSPVEPHSLAVGLDVIRMILILTGVGAVSHLELSYEALSHREEHSLVADGGAHLCTL